MRCLFAVHDKDKIHLIHPVSEDRFKWIVGQVLELVQISYDEDLFKVSKANHAEFKKMILRLKDAYEKSEANFESYNDNLFEVNRNIINLLASVRMFLDHTETRINRKFGESSKEYFDFKKQTATAYDTSFAYRFLNHFRNYTQHCGLATDSIIIKSAFEKNGGIECNISIRLNRERLLSNYDWKKLTQELSQQDENFDVVVLIDELINILSTISENINKDLYSKYTSTGKDIANLLRQVKKIPGAPCLLAEKVNGSLDGTEITYFPLKLIEKIPEVVINLPLKTEPPTISKNRDITFIRHF